MKYHLLILALTLLLLPSCRNSAKNTKEPRKLVFEVPAPPAMMQDQNEIANYMAAHYWDKFDFSDTAYVNVPEITEQALSNYLYILNNMDQAKAREAVYNFMGKARADSSMYAYMAELSEKYLYDPNSPFRNEELYIRVLDNILDWDKPDELAKLRPQAQYNMALKNRVGTKAADITFTQPDGRTRTLYGIKSEYTIIYIYNPDCNACAEVTQALSNSEILGPLMDKGILTVAAIYPDEDLALWREHLKDMPKNWVNGYNKGQTIRNGAVYDLRAIPTLYLLNSSKDVVIKDAATISPIENYFYMNYMQKRL